MKILKEFTYLNYKEMIDAFRENGFSFDFFSSNLDGLDPYVLIRHDVDFSLKKALEMAEFENKIGLKSTFLFLLRSHFYNLFSSEANEIINKILSLGHEIGLHFDCSLYPKNKQDEICRASNKEVSVMSELFSYEVKVISFHRPSKEVLKDSSAFTTPLINTYDDKFIKNISYISDSQGLWKYGHPLESQAYKTQRSLQILTHPIWWNVKAKSNLETLYRYVKDSCEGLEENISRNCKIFPK